VTAKDWIGKGILWLGRLLRVIKAAETELKEEEEK
tara:strand:- start:656 stop:760 length:105 start_codon:yes stop_codon:yes gene_type:complete